MEHHSNEHRKIVFETDQMHHMGRRAPHYGHHHHYSSRLAHWIVTHSGGAIKTNTQAAGVMLGIAVLFFVISFFFFLHGSGVSETQLEIQVPEGKTLIRPYDAPPYVQ